MSDRWWRLQEWELLTLLFSAGLSLAWLLVGFAAAMHGLLGTQGSGSWNVPGPSPDPLGIVRTVILLPIYVAFYAIGMVARWTNWQPSNATFFVVALAFGLGFGLAAGSALIAYLRWRG
jgi:hypothetical protein